MRQLPDTENGKALVTMDEIVVYVGWHKNKIKEWIETENFPAVKLDGRWESNTALIDSWRRKRLEEKVRARCS